MSRTVICRPKMGLMALYDGSCPLCTSLVSFFVGSPVLLVSLKLSPPPRLYRLHAPFFVLCLLLHPKKHSRSCSFFTSCVLSMSVLMDLPTTSLSLLLG